jgi:transcription initiation factor TFIID subunit 9B
MATTNGALSDPPSSDPQRTALTPPPPTASQTALTSFQQPSTQNANNDPLSNLSRDDGLARRPRDARLIHMLLANAGISSYQERVPLQLMDFAYRYTTSTLQDALHLSTEAYNPPTTKASSAADLSGITLPGLRLSIASRTHYQYAPVLPKEFYLETASEKNKVGLPAVGKDSGGRLPPEKYCLTGVNWALRAEWDSDGSEHDGEEGEIRGGREVEMEEADGEEDEKMEDFFGEEGT